MGGWVDERRRKTTIAHSLTQPPTHPPTQQAKEVGAVARVTDLHQDCFQLLREKLLGGESFFPPTHPPTYTSSTSHSITSFSPTHLPIQMGLFLPLLFLLLLLLPRQSERNLGDRGRRRESWRRRGGNRRGKQEEEEEEEEEEVVEEVVEEEEGEEEKGRVGRDCPLSFLLLPLWKQREEEEEEEKQKGTSYLPTNPPTYLPPPLSPHPPTQSIHPAPRMNRLLFFYLPLHPPTHPPTYPPTY